MKSNLKHFNLQEWHQNTHDYKSLCKQILLLEKKLKTYQEQPHLVSGHFIKVFYKTTTCPRQLLLSGSKSGHLIQVRLYIFVSLERLPLLQNDNSSKCAIWGTG